MAKGKNHNRKNDDFRIIELRMKIARQYLEGQTQEEVAKDLGLSVASVSNHLKKIREYWLSLMMVDFDEKKSREIAKIDNLERIAFRAWRRSTRPTQTRHVSVKEAIRVEKQRDKDGKEVPGKAPLAKMVPIEKTDDTKETTQAGDPRFLQIIDRCIEKRLKLMGALKEDNGGTNIYLDFGSILKQHSEQQKALPRGDVIENIIASVGTPELSNKERTNGQRLADHNGAEGEGDGEDH